MGRINARLTIFQRGMTAGDSVRLQDMCIELKAQLEAYKNVLPKQEKVQKLLKYIFELYIIQGDR